ncbi:double zinc ribbon domain-containing protein [Desulfotalea psychrophila]|uniref:DZANK-type domain-containing protein n=1 Tax=Desulfotalea psychrophila (strain LSv54 / DSM 12343) TaxID=177439 RepID=Q6AKH6_DESPS|nr:zinc ribbon domain-containing protein [Desulfotalea psychrophila]CAG37149.1 unknown protein [Desulfotalea psychrophila LSv54]
MSNINQSLCFHCGQNIKPGAIFCGYCGKSTGVNYACPKCGADVPSGNFCGQCGYDMRTSATVESDVVAWIRGDDDFAAKVSATHLVSGSKGFEVRHGTKALFFEDGRLVETAESGRYTIQEGGFLNKLFKKQKNLSALLVDAGDIVLPFKIDDMKTNDNIFVSISTEIVIRLEDANAFFVNVMKEQGVLKNHELRAMLLGEIRNAIQEGLVAYSFDELDTNLKVKNELAVRIESHFRKSFTRSGFGFGQVRSLQIGNSTLDTSAKAHSERKTSTRAVQAEAQDAFHVAKQNQENEELHREIKRGDIVGAKSDMGIKVDTQSVSLQDRGLDNDFELKKEHQDVDFKKKSVEIIEKRLEVYQKIKEADISQVKTDEEVRKFMLEIDRDQVLDAAEKKIFADELRWQDEDKGRDRSFLVRKVEEQQQFDLDKLAIINDGSLQVEQIKQELVAVEVKQNSRLKTSQQEAEVELLREKAELAKKEVKELGEKEIEVQKHLKDLEMKKAELDLTIENVHDKAKARHGFATLELEEKRLKSQLGLSNLEKMKAIKRADKFENDLHEQELALGKYEMRMKEEVENHKMRLEEKRFSSQIDREKRADIATMSTAQLISVSGDGQAGILGDLAQTEILKGMSAEEILAMNDPAALGRALEEKAKNSQSGEVKDLYERMIFQMKSSTEQLSSVHKDAANRNERMFNQGMESVGGQQQGLAQAERHVADRVERMADRSVQQMGNVASSQTGSSAGVAINPGGGEKV